MIEMIISYFIIGMFCLGFAALFALPLLILVDEKRRDKWIKVKSYK